MMKRYLAAMLVVALALSCGLYALAGEDVTEPDPPTDPPTEPTTEPPPEPTEVSTVDDPDPVTDETALKYIISALFGEYTPRTRTVTVHLADGTTAETTEIIPGVAGMDWHWIAGVGLFSVVLLCFFKALGGVLKRG